MTVLIAARNLKPRKRMDSWRAPSRLPEVLMVEEKLCYIFARFTGTVNCSSKCCGCCTLAGLKYGEKEWEAWMCMDD